ncbi:hypothetical protein [Odoribacter splanchnicus]|jgi:hypothetical protein|uniref:Uncharacterized protein n=1 Tax=Odoribacter splanchnicus TaxID=28118 RepID=A0A412WQ65_9BACT|nr:hypothetical protein [Odoribacter splanchnicus]RGV29270.1 hypothetical protein DWW24_04105 [Odoribacter splanchnicus]
MTKNRENLKAAISVASIQRPPRRNEGKLLQLEREIKTLKSENQELKTELAEQKRQNILEKQKKEEEKRCKNRAYYFILSDGAFQRFAEFHKTHRANLDYHGACLAQLYLDSFTTK